MDANPNRAQVEGSITLDNGGGNGSIVTASEAIISKIWNKGHRLLDSVHLGAM